MANPDLIGAQMLADHAVLPLAARDAMHRPELALASPEIARAVTRYEVASARTVELSAAMDTRQLTGAEFDSLVLAQDVMAASQATLAAAGQLHLIEVQ
ncbi:hypothetical protein AB0N14_13620 [Streptomyces sp. NPDC051104]|uniref:hypothetical protein n=1 Tax=Streptomyces sp. NPDC051104 TaxID=3155044 RepID=UPI003449B5F8